MYTVILKKSTFQ